jgi:N-acetyl-gamma-glutamylphosphate reductase
MATKGKVLMKKLKQKILELLRKNESQKNFQRILNDFKGVPVSQLYMELNYPSKQDLQGAIIELYNEKKIIAIGDEGSIDATEHLKQRDVLTLIIKLSQSLEQ